MITIGITCYNAAATILRALECAERQTYPDTEIIVVDDCSTDNSVALITGFIGNKQNIRLIRHAENKGFPGALNTIVANAAGEYIAFFDDDDVSLPERLELQHEKITAYEKAHHTQAVFCYANRAIVRAGQTEIDHIAYAIGREAPEPRGEAVADFLLWHSSDRAPVWGLFGSCTLMIRKDFLKELGPFDESFRRSAEWDMAIRAAFKGAHFIAVNQPLVTQYKTPTSDKSGKTPLRYALQLRRKYRSYLEGKGVYPAALCMANYHYHCDKGHKAEAVVWFGLACLLAPRLILWEKIRHNLKQHEV